VNSETDPPQSEDVDRAIADLLADDVPTPDPWWRAGVEDALEE
jgi:hypothetical protein